MSVNVSISQLQPAKLTSSVESREQKKNYYSDNNYGKNEVSQLLEQSWHIIKRKGNVKLLLQVVITITPLTGRE